MATGGATTVAGYLSELPTERRAAVAKVRGIIRKWLPKGYRESVNSGMICYAVPLSAYPDTYNGRPLCYVALAAQKSHLALYLMPVYMNPKLRHELEAGFRRAGKRLDMGKSCVRFRSSEDLPLEVIGDIVASTPMDKFIAIARSVKHR